MAQPSLTRIAYQTLQQGKGLVGLAHKGISTKLMELLIPEAIPETSPITTDLLLELRDSAKSLEEIDWLEAERGLYPKNLLFDVPWIEWFFKYPLVWLDMPSTWKRRKKKHFQDLPKTINKENYPDYYLQNFHHQTDGYLSDHSAELYDMQVEILFNGTADAMRRRVISPLKEGLELGFSSNNFANYKVLDIATGTGRTLKQIRSAIPEIELVGLDLSTSYLKQASKYLNNYQKSELVQLVKGNAERMPLLDNSFHAITCVFLFHELPSKARQNVLKECFRVLKPNGSLILADSIQINDSPQFTQVMENFYRIFHEPYYRNYIKDDINLRLTDSGFVSIKANSFFMTRIWSATKPS
ncbi:MULTISPECIES: class I SAM-dependent methyltransferase [Prochlorococcus]|uniref:SAM-dependent methyltransferase n=1 Tax=Prochlorococcus marinus (strain SARG / CCMP1375 / SS120) TaxID=167539 RepID=Q7VBQ2_PROMA|nr:MULTISPECIES: class I SAM-dependent methyltransferase [Prochlorococcus]AAQ00085.1 SAM-dependent methyltransferase [Prochlorococcus marinus subsp. marinus str. CCMP1375]KGG13881.1 SAM-dependent methyltransferase [Prochlorococcus marinus str. LG]KGG19014.1 SAM-dependent methyltransferase [Prochlorococcus marinus str. SS2]KGG23446.1 SAM-dependent methyltransferase [Prochlorococcus marinus str. SS35]KGG32318.1 SAM-dependent methyltransferase [Prochlorococcus marinus str. SS51]